MNKYKEALDLVCNINYELDIFLEKYHQVQMNWNSSNVFKNYIKEISNFENKYGNMPAGILQELVDKEEPMKTVLYKVNEYDEHFHKCPKCGCELGHNIIKSTLFKYCSECGQKQDWRV